jgi:hypothetical protein
MRIQSGGREIQMHVMGRSQHGKEVGEGNKRGFSFLASKNGHPRVKNRNLLKEGYP